ncbi:recombinase family protein [Streptomyces sp. NPDC050619]|uniref:recombinase family protein n=1 Tax=Streptomyces sp. NPDC050619 TaxID=3157214 RepID=UPI003433A974
MTISLPGGPADQDGGVVAEVQRALCLTPRGRGLGAAGFPGPHSRSVAAVLLRPQVLVSRGPACRVGGPAQGATGRTTSSVREVLTNPKYTGHMVWNRRARKAAGRNPLNPVGQWVWSTAPVPQALVDLETFVRAPQVAEGRRRSRPVPGPNQHPQTNRIYRLHGYVVRALCGRRIHGKPSGRTTYYVCAPKAEYRPDMGAVTTRGRRARSRQAGAHPQVGSLSTLTCENTETPRGRPPTAWARVARPSLGRSAGWER